MKSHDDIIRDLREHLREEPGGALQNRIFDSAAAAPAAPPYTGRRRAGLRTAIIAAAVTALTLTAAFAYGGQVIQLLGGGRIETGKPNDGKDYSSISTGFESDPAEIRDGRVYFVLDGSDTDITNYCTEETYYEYEQIADNGYRHVVIVGGTPDRLGWGEFIWDEKGNLLGSNATVRADEDDEKPQWLRNADETLEVQKSGIVYLPGERDEGSRDLALKPLGETAENWVMFFYFPPRERIIPETGEMGIKSHNGVDIPAPENTPVLAVAAGKVSEMGENDYGYTVVIDHGDGLQSSYWHLGAYAEEIAAGDYVEKGEIIGYIKGEYPVYPAAACTVIDIGENDEDGLYLTVEFDVGNEITVFTPLVRLTEGIAVGDKLGKEDIIGFIMRPHLHFGMLLNGEYIDPMDCHYSDD